MQATTMPSISLLPSCSPHSRRIRHHTPLVSPAVYRESHLSPFTCPKQRPQVVLHAANTAAPSTSTPESSPPLDPPYNRSHETDYVVIGSGIGGLCCAALLARYGYAVTVLESHYLPGGAAHSFDIQVVVGSCRFDGAPHTQELHHLYSPVARL